MFSEIFRIEGVGGIFNKLEKSKYILCLYGSQVPLTYNEIETNEMDDDAHLHTHTLTLKLLLFISFRVYSIVTHAYQMKW